MSNTMKYYSTRDNTRSFTLSECLLQGLAPDGGLFIPETLPTFNLAEFADIPSYSKLCQQILQPFFAGDPLAHHLTALCNQAFNFDVILQPLNQSTTLLELFHGPTLSFKDFGARFLAACLSQLATTKITILVATSGDTGSAVAAAFHNKPNIEVIVLFPEGKISKRQQQQITCWDHNVTAYAIKGTFDDCQRLVKAAFSNLEWQRQTHLCTANSINLGRLLPQTCYYAYASLQRYQQLGEHINFIVPSGNLGNVTAAFWAKNMGFPIERIVIATNANCVVSDYLNLGEYQPRQSIQTLANAMDVGKPSNFERLTHLFTNYDSFKREVTAYSVSDQKIKQTIQHIFMHHQKIICPHTATACWIRPQLTNEHWIIASTAHPCKFETVIEPLIQQRVTIDAKLAKMFANKSHYITIKPEDFL